MFGKMNGTGFIDWKMKGGKGGERVDAADRARREFNGVGWER